MRGPAWIVLSKPPTTALDFRTRKDTACKLSLIMAFELSLGQDQDLKEVIDIIQKTNGDDELFRYAFKDVPYEEVHAFFFATFGERYAMEDIYVFAIREKSIG